MNAILTLGLEASFRAAALDLAVTGILAAARIRSGSIRHAAWTAVLCAMLLMPLASRLTPSLGLPFAMPWVSDAITPHDSALPAVEPTPILVLRSTSPAPVPIAAANGATRIMPVFDWTWAALAVYLAGLTFLLAQMAQGWLISRRIARLSTPVLEASPSFHVCQSPLVTAPVTVGVLAPAIVLPNECANWPKARLQAVLAHETAHVRRHDTLVSLAAHLNRAVFWFNPVSWWLARQISITAELACDEAGVRASDSAPDYAQILVDVATTVRRSGGRLSWQAGLGGAVLEQRINFILRGDAVRRVSRMRKGFVAAACLAAIVLAAGCKQQPSQNAGAQRNKAASERAAAVSKANRELSNAARSMTSQEAGALEAALSNNPEDLQTRKKLMYYYQFASAGPQVKAAERQAAISTLHKHILWFIEHHPEESFSSWGVPARDSDLKFYADAKQLWQRGDRDGAPAAAYLNGAQFLMYVDPPFAEKLLLRAQAADPSAESLGGMYGGSWSARLGSFYGQSLAYSSIPDFPLKRLSTAEEMASFVAQVRHKLEQSNDTTLLLFAVQNPLASFRPNEPGRAAATEIFRFAQQLVDRVIQLDPKQTRAYELRHKIRDQELASRLPKPVTEGQLESRVPAIRALPEGERFREMSILAISAWDAAIRVERYRNVPGGAPLQGSYEQAGRYAQEALSLAPEAKNHPDYGVSLLRANVMAGMAAQKAGDIKAAVRYLNASLDGPISEDMKYPIIDARPWPNNWRPPFVLLAALYRAGERSSLADYLERYARVSVSDHNRCLEIAADIRAGRVPNWPYSSDGR